MNFDTALNPNNVYEKTTETFNFLRTKIDFSPDIGIILGTGLGQLASEIKSTLTLPYNEIPHFLKPTVESHSGRLIFGELSGKKVVAMQGRFHYYEGYEMVAITFPVRVMHKLGIKTLIVSNAAGGLNPKFKVSDLMVITDHINLMGANPLRGVNDPRLGPRFPDMYNCYDKDLVKLAKRIARKLRIKLQSGVYIAVAGPNLETAAEYGALRILGADAVGMSTVPEVIVARQLGIRVLGFSVITDLGIPEELKPCNFEDVLKAASIAEPKLTRLITAVIKELK
ncbi:MAG: purine-nucleoside phosphorylase [candidate division WOR-3 bacterium]|nr:purine-nucleoside phosphorylase [candidate division WOR-3 bacterium]MDW7987679.1 purine-nucleoside phosphorylase [candidate division WOR-3 bacterium]